LDWLTFTSEVLRILAWPITILVVVVVLKRPITTLIREVIRVKWKDLEIEFERDIKQVAKDADLVLPPPPLEIGVTDQISVGTKADATVSEETTKVAGMAELYPPAAILEAWLDLEVVLRHTAARHSIETTDRKPTLLLARELLDLGKLDKETFRIFEKLRDLRNKVVHARVTDVSTSQALEFYSISRRLASKLAKL